MQLFSIRWRRRRADKTTPPPPRREDLFKRAHTNSQGEFYDPEVRELSVSIAFIFSWFVLGGGGEQTKQRPPPPRREDLFKRAHTNSQGEFYDPEAKMTTYVAEQAEVGTQVEAIGPHDAVAAVLGDEHPSWVCCLGFGQTPKRAFGTARSGSTFQSTIATTYTTQLEQENQQLREKVDNLQLNVVNLNSHVLHLQSFMERMKQQYGMPMPDPFPTLNTVQSHASENTPVPLRDLDSHHACPSSNSGPLVHM
ncbi:PREDICTED: uncharacterized protein LOC104602775 isoform X2 [Nelumbo nucifera]|uniref:Uncharacterized protein LOC104602775 isoform X2 n=1 Tax=Nelumbo nucifera TaxID=4432 RepID=A0A1U8AD96_NELNU|nr:PREDICTED: uncharacterized protein LOC104602775 isoform X2 [Nelumbo nucifera]